MEQLLEKVTEDKMIALILSKKFVRNISHYKKNTERYDHKYIQVFT
jgi:hypothetical protein